FFFSSRRRHTRSKRDWSSDVCSSDLLSGIRAVLDFVLLSKLIRSKSVLYTVSVRQSGILPPASFRFHLTTPLPLANSSYCHACSGLSPPSYSPCRAH